ncbi:GDP-mannose 4,6-dehydratase [candidate division WWE3 bacterium]|nr:GDP-mannose 4,6-dehydratase [candidate division WWE3 bacterium]
MNKKYWKSKNVFVTGAAGMLGSELVKVLADASANVTVVIRDKVSKSRLFLEGYDARVNVVQGDVADFAIIERIIGEYEIDTVFHLAAQTIVRIGNASPLSTFDSNIRGTWNVLEACRLHSERIKAVVVASSDKAYGPSDKLPYDEQLPLRGQHPYDVSKSCTDLLTQCYWHTYKAPVSITRCGNLFGPGDLNFNRIIPGTILSIMRGERPIIRSDGKYIRNYFYIKDAANAYVAIAENIKRVSGEAFNVGGIERYSVLEITDTILKVMGSKLEPIVKNEATNEIYEQYLDTAKIRRMLKWKPKYSVEKALRETVRWYKKYVR